MKTRKLGPYTVSAIGLGAMPLSMSNDGRTPTEAEAIGTIHAALDAGVTFIDTADCYAPQWDQMGHNELIVGKAVRSWAGDRDSVVIASKGGITRSDGELWGRDGSLQYLRRAVENSLRNLGVEAIDLYQYHRPDRWKTYGEVVSHFGTLQQEGKIKAIGISNANIEEIEIAIDILGDRKLISVQNQFSPSYPSSYEELQYCGANGVAFLPWSPLGGTGGGASNVGDRFAAFGEIATAHQVSPQQVVLAWELSLGDHVIPIPGSRRPASITDSAQAPGLQLTDDELRCCSRSVGLEPTA